MRKLLSRSGFPKKLAVRREFHFRVRVRDPRAHAGIVRRADTRAGRLLSSSSNDFCASGRRVPGWPRAADDRRRRTSAPLCSRSDRQEILLGRHRPRLFRLFGSRPAVLASRGRPIATHGRRDRVRRARSSSRGGADRRRAVVARARRYLRRRWLGHRRIRSSTRSRRASARRATETSLQASSELANPAALPQSAEQGFCSCLDGARPQIQDEVRRLCRDRRFVAALDVRDEDALSLELRPRCIDHG